MALEFFVLKLKLIFKWSVLHMKLKMNEWTLDYKEGDESKSFFVPALFSLVLSSKSLPN